MRGLQVDEDHMPGSAWLRTTQEWGADRVPRPRDRYRRSTRSLSRAGVESNRPPRHARVIGQPPWSSTTRGNGRMASPCAFSPSIAGEVVTVTIELVGGYEIPDPEYNNPTIRALSEMTGLIAALDNDLHSFAKTVVMGETNQWNIIGVVAAQDGCSLEAAVDRAIPLRGRDHVSIPRIECTNRKLRPRYSPIRPRPRARHPRKHRLGIDRATVHGRHRCGSTGVRGIEQRSARDHGA